MSRECEIVHGSPVCYISARSPVRATTPTHARYLATAPMSPGQPPRRPDAEHGAATPLLGRQEEEPRPDGGQVLGNGQLEQAAAAGADADNVGVGVDGGGESFPWLTILGFLFLTFNSGMAIYRSQGDIWAIAFVLFSYGDLTLLFACLRMYERTDENSPRRYRLKVAVWLLTTMLTAAFSYKVAAIMPLPVAMLVWAMAFFTVAGGYYAFFLHTEK